MYILSTRRQGVECVKSWYVHSVYLQHFTASCNRNFLSPPNMRNAYMHDIVVVHSQLQQQAAAAATAMTASSFSMLVRGVAKGRKFEFVH